MRPLTDEETKVFFQKLSSFIGDNIKHLLTREDGTYCFRLHEERIYYVSQRMAAIASTIKRENLISIGTCFGKFTRSKNFRLHITALDYLAPYSPYKVTLREASENHFLYGNHVLKYHVLKISDNTPKNQGVIICSSKGLPLGFGVSSKPSTDFKNSDPMTIIALHQADIGEFIRNEERLT